MSLFFPQLMVRRIQELSPAGLRRAGVRGILLDVDNTLSLHDAAEPDPQALEWIRTMQQEGFLLRVVSNNREERVAPFAGRLGVGFSAKAAKPLPFGFRRAARELGLTPGEVMAVGDQLFTDIAGANLAGIRSVLVEPMQPETPFRFRLKRRLEKPLLRWFCRRYPERVASSCLKKLEKE